MSLLSLPDEVLRNLLFYLDPEDTLCGFQLLNQHAARLAREPLLWKYYCIHSFRFWDARHGFEAQLRRPAVEVEWKKLFALRKRQDARIVQCFTGILESKLGRWAKVEEICDLGYDAKEFLIEECNADTLSEFGLARRYWGRAILDSLHKSIAIQQWHDLATRSPKYTQLDAVLVGFDLFVLGANEGDHYDTSRMLDEIAAKYLVNSPGFESWSTREKAVSLNRWLRARNLMGLRNPERDYRNLRNCLLGHALRHQEHESIPVISSAIFACVARRLGLEVGCCGFPTHVHAVVFPPVGQTLDGESLETSANDTEPPKMYLDPFGNDDEVPVEALKALLVRFGWQTDTSAVLAMMSDATVVARVAGNISETNNLFHNSQTFRDGGSTTHDYTELIDGHGWPVMSACHYASLWSNLLLTQPNHFGWIRHLEELLDHVARTFPEDCWLVERYLMPNYNRIGPFHNINLRLESRETLRMIRRADEERGLRCERADGTYGTPAYHVGDVFRHHRYGYLGIITGWSSQASRNAPAHDSTSDHWQPHYPPLGLMNRLQMDDKMYYTYIRSMTSERYIATEDNIELVQDPILVQQCKFVYAGKYFQRFDPESCRFISNVREQFPDD